MHSSAPLCEPDPTLATPRSKGRYHGGRGERKGSVASFRLRRFVVWSLPPTHVTKEERDNSDQLHRGPFPSRAHAHGSPLVSGLSAAHAPCRSTHARTWVHVDHSTVHRGVIHYRPHLEEALHRRKRPVGVRWRRDETSIKVKGVWRYL